MRHARGRVPPVCFGHAVRVEHLLRPQPARGYGDGRALVWGQFVTLRESHALHGVFDQVVEEAHLVAVRRVVLCGTVGHLDDQPAGAVDEQRQGVVAGDRMRVDA